MDQLPITKTPYPDELLHSYILRLANANFIQIDNFIGYAFHGMKYDEYQNKTRYDSLFFLNSFFHLLKDENHFETFLSTSIYTALSPFLTEEERAYFLGFCFSDFYYQKEIWPKSRNYYIRELKVCPECREEDIKLYGEMYYHRSHQLNGVNVCYKHHKPLISVEEGKELDFTNTNFSSSSLAKDESLDLESETNYAEFIHILFYPNSEFRDKWLTRLKNDESIDEFLLKVRDLILCELGSAYKNSVLDIKERLIYYLENERYPSREIENKEGSDYIIIKPIQDNVYLCKCKLCGKDFIATALTLSIGYTCTCTRENKTSDEIIRRSFDVGFSDRYIWIYLHKRVRTNLLLLYDKYARNTLLIKSVKLFLNNFQRVAGLPKTFHEEPIEGLEKDILQNLTYTLTIEDDSIYYDCKICGHSVKYGLNEKYIPECPNCKENRLLNEVREIIKSFGGEFEIVSTEDIMGGKIKILHKDCGHIGERYIYDLKNYNGTICKGCNEMIFRPFLMKEEPSWIIEAEDIIEKYNGRLSLGDPSVAKQSKIPIIHNKCGHTIYRTLSIFKSNYSVYCDHCQERVHQGKYSISQRQISTIKKAESLLEEFEPGLKLVVTDKVNYEKIPVLHEECDSISYKELKTLKTSNFIFCSGCNKRIYKKAHKKKLDKKVRENLESRTFNILEDFNGKFVFKSISNLDKREVDIIHKSCSHTITLSYSQLNNLKQNKSIFCPGCKKRIYKSK